MENRFHDCYPLLKSTFVSLKTDVIRIPLSTNRPDAQKKGRGGCLRNLLFNAD
jgi:hypothetical protein